MHVHVSKDFIVLGRRSSSQGEQLHLTSHFSPWSFWKLFSSQWAKLPSTIKPVQHNLSAQANSFNIFDSQLNQTFAGRLSPNTFIMITAFVMSHKRSWTQFKVLPCFIKEIFLTYCAVSGTSLGCFLLYFLPPCHIKWISALVRIFSFLFYRDAHIIKEQITIRTSDLKIQIENNKDS